MLILLGYWLFGDTNCTEEGLFVYLSSFLENAICEGSKRFGEGLGEGLAFGTAPNLLPGG
jgi:hypothetical protein